jgi:5-methylcytosine-specific restriction endonuclease McrA
MTTSLIRGSWSATMPDDAMLPGMPTPLIPPGPPIPGLCPRCPRCTHRHLSELPCWAGRLVGEMRALVWVEHGTVCHLCGLPGADTVDHVQARSMGGTDDLANLMPAHLYCNQHRGTKPVASRPPARPHAFLTSTRWDVDHTPTRWGEPPQ